ncbi:Type 1 glutamine amidotransferase-like domain-containing protein [Nocardioides litoris]|uniref:Type 1 glutamine amidotransferase-like domain-containing protein n=1 Tax=Nocardioides litoris TaxID=1926648 RepID=UPI00111D4DF7|nr:Type 1 glutamine amidotransferase-like domain-containing protein [Nocardioides litoris]
MKLLLTAAGVRNDGIRQALLDLLGKPVEEASALAVPTAQYAHPWVGPGEKPWRFVSGAEDGMVGLGWRSVGLLELTALQSLPREAWEPVVRGADVLLVAGGDVLYLAHWLRESGVADLLPELADTVWVGLSAGSMVLTTEVGSDFVQWRPPSGDESGLGLVDFSICPHLAPDGEPGNSLAEAEDWAARLSGRPGRSATAYAMDDDCAIVVDGDRTEVVGGGWWVELRPGMA